MEIENPEEENHNRLLDEEIRWGIIIADKYFGLN